MNTMWPEYGIWGSDPFSEFRRLQREMDHVLRGYDRGVSAFPAVNVYAKNDEAVITAELLGMAREDIHLSVAGNQITLDGERKADDPANDVVCHRRERGNGRFVRTIRLPFDVEESKVTATYKDGILTVSMPRAEASKPRKIEITGT